MSANQLPGRQLKTEQLWTMLSLPLDMEKETEAGNCQDTKMYPYQWISTTIKSLRTSKIIQQYIIQVKGICSRSKRCRNFQQGTDCNLPCFQRLRTVSVFRSYHFWKCCLASSKPLFRNRSKAATASWMEIWRSDVGLHKYTLNWLNLWCPACSKKRAFINLIYSMHLALS